MVDPMHQAFRQRIVVTPASLTRDGAPCKRHRVLHADVEKRLRFQALA